MYVRIYVCTRHCYPASHGLSLPYILFFARDKYYSRRSSASYSRVFSVPFASVIVQGDVVVLLRMRLIWIFSPALTSRQMAAVIYIECHHIET